MNKGFTLIELLVVVLIIGILSSIALPQYTKAVEKSRAAEARAFLADFVTGQTIYHMAAGQYAADADKNNMDVSLPYSTLKNFTAGGIIGGGSGATKDKVGIVLTRNSSSMPYALQVVLNHDQGTGLDTPTLKCCSASTQICTAIKTGSTTVSGTTYTGWAADGTTVAACTGA